MSVTLVIPPFSFFSAKCSDTFRPSHRVMGRTGESLTAGGTAVLGLHCLSLDLLFWKKTSPCLVKSLQLGFYYVQLIVILNDTPMTLIKRQGNPYFRTNSFLIKKMDVFIGFLFQSAYQRNKHVEANKCSNKHFLLILYLGY